VGRATNERQLLVDNRLYYRMSHYVACLDVTTGRIIWQVNNKNVSNCSPNMIYNDGMIITGCFGTGRVTIIDAETGMQIHSELSPNNYNYDVVYDKETDMYFTQDFAYAVGFKINKP
jgi:outer membrane protein assembly factor BamB